jgi:hypothetical protein
MAIYILIRSLWRRESLRDAMGRIADWSEGEPWHWADRGAKDR